MKLKLKSKTQAQLEVIKFVFDSEEEVSWRAGQFAQYQLEHENPDDRGTKRFFTIASAPHEKDVWLTTRFSDQGSSFKRALKKLEPGEEIDMLRVAGPFVMANPEAQHIFIAGGIGITPYRAILKDLDYKKQPMNVKLLYGNRDESIVFQEELEELAKKHPTFSIKYFIGSQIDQDAIRQNSQPDQDIYWLSGPEPMVESFEQMLAEMGVAKDHIKTDYFPGYTEY